MLFIVHTAPSTVVSFIDKLLFQIEPRVRLRGGSRSHEGRLEVFHHGHWGTVCNTYFYPEAATVACREMGFGSVSKVLQRTPFGRGASYIWLQDIFCRGNEGSVFDCQHTFKRHADEFRYSGCTHVKDASIICRVPRYVPKVKRMFPIRYYLLYH